MNHYQEIAKMSLDEVRREIRWLERGMADPYPDDDKGGDIMVSGWLFKAQERLRELTVVLSPKELEKFMIPSDRWESVLDEVPEEGRKIIKAEMESPSGPTGLGHHASVGWFIIMSGQGPFVAWKERGEVL